MWTKGGAGRLFRVFCSSRAHFWGFRRKTSRRGRFFTRRRSITCPLVLHALSGQKINRSHAHTHDSRTNHSHEHRASNGATTTTLNSREVIVPAPKLPPSAALLLSSERPTIRVNPNSWEFGLTFPPEESKPRVKGALGP